MSEVENTLSIIKPDAVERNLSEEIKAIFIKKGFTILKLKMFTFTKELATEFYSVHKDKPFFGELLEYMTSGPVVVQVLKGKSAVKKNRDLMGATNPENADENTIRKLYGISVEQNSVHGSDSNSNAKIEIDFFFSDREILD